jgi:transcriptional regulator MraZ
MFRGTATVKVDDKGRLKLPTFVKERLDARYGADSAYFVTSLTGDVALIYPLTEWERMEQILSQAPQFDKLKKKFLFQANQYGAEAALDDQGRLLIPSKLREQAGMKGEVRLNWESNHIEVLSQARYEEEADKNRLTPEDFENLKNLGI